MAEAPSSNKRSLCRYAVVTGANKGIGLEICRQLASKGVTVVLTARDEKRGLEAVEKLKTSCGFSDDLVVFHQLDVADPTTVASLATFIKKQFGRLDILVNNAGVLGALLDGDRFSTLVASAESQAAAAVGQVRWDEVPALKEAKWDEIFTQTYETANECLKTNYYGAKNMIEAHIPLLQLSNSPRIVNVSSSLGKLKLVTSEWAKGVLSDIENLMDKKIDEVLNEFLEGVRDGSFKANGWSSSFSGYTYSKAAMNAYTRILAKKYPNFYINCVCPGFVKTDINYNAGTLTVEEGAEGPVRLALLSNGGPSGRFFSRTEESSFDE